MRIDTAYTLAARDDIASAIDHFMLRKLPEHARKAVLDLGRGTEYLLREKLSLVGCREDIDRATWRALLKYLRDEDMALPWAALDTLRRMRNDAEHAGTYPKLAELEEVAKSIFPFIWGFMHADLGFAPGEGFENYHAAVLRGEPLTLCAKAKLFSAAAMRHVDEEPQYGVEFADTAVDCIVRDLAQSCGIDQEGMTFAEVVPLLMEMRDDCAPWYAIPIGDGEYSDLRYVTPDFIDHLPLRMDEEAAEAYVVLARYVVSDILAHLHRPEWEATIRRRWSEVLALLAHEAPHSYCLVPQSLADESSIHVYGDTIRIRPVDGAHSGDRALAADIEEALRQVMREFPPEFRVEVRTLYSYWISEDDVDDDLPDA